MRNKKKNKTIRTKDGIILHHSQTRGKKRNKHGRGMTANLFKKALKFGIGYEEAEGELKDFIKRKYIAGGRKANNIRVYGREVYIAKGNLCFTTYELPEYLWHYWDAWSRKLKGEC